MTNRFLLCFLVVFVFSSCSSAIDCSDQQNASCTRVLFLGNSYTFVNDLPNTFAQLANAGKHAAKAGVVAEGGWTLADHVQSGSTHKALRESNWDYVVLQEQSQIPSVEQSRTFSMYPAARALVQEIRDRNASPILFLTWAHQDGYPEEGMKDYESMQYQIKDGYIAISRELNVPVAEVGSAWLAAVRSHPELHLWQEDGSHPSEEGTYLAACVFYAVIFQESPIDLPYRARLSKETATTLQTIASETVLGIP